MKYNINVDKIRENKAKIQNEIEEIDNLCKECYNKIDSTIEYFDTPTAKIFRDKAIELIAMGEDYIRDSLLPFVESIDNCAQIYEDLFKDIGVLNSSIQIDSSADNTNMIDYSGYYDA